MKQTTLDDIKIEMATPVKTVVKKDGKRQVGPIYGDFTSNSTYKLVPLNKLRVDHAYQRPMNRQRVSKMAHAWSQDLVGMLVTSYRRNEDSFYVIDGQQRLGAMQMMVNPPDVVLCQVFDGLTVEEEAKLFEELDTKRNGLTKGQIFTALLIAKDRVALEIKEAAEQNGLTVDIHSNAPNNLRAFGTLMDIHRRSGKTSLSRILRVVSKAWPDNKYWGAGAILTGLEALYKKYPEVIDTRLIDALGRTNPQLIESKARTLSQALTSSISPWVARVMLILYNKGMKRNRLPDWDD